MVASRHPAIAAQGQPVATAVGFEVVECFGAEVDWKSEDWSVLLQEALFPLGSRSKNTDFFYEPQRTQRAQRERRDR
jgi:hypothetical protein